MNQPPNVDEMLAKVPLFSRLDRKEMQAVRSLFSQVDIQKGNVLAREGSQGAEFFVILSGTASVDKAGTQIAEVGPGDFQGEISLIDGGPRTASVTATSDMIIMVASKREFDSLLDSTPTVARQMLPALAHRLRALADDAVTH
jgi:CRP/FNR family transcriptional regulator, cyclic AMP receptor protein